MYDIVIIGSGLSSTSFLKGLKFKNKKIAIISPLVSQVSNKSNKKKIEKYVMKNLPPRFNEKKDIKNIVNFFVENKINFDKEISIFGSLQHGGVSNYWGGSCEFLNENQINFLNKKNRIDLIKSYSKIANDNNFSGKLNYSNKIKAKYFNALDKNFKQIIIRNSDKNIKFFENENAQNYKNGKLYLPLKLNEFKTIRKLNLIVKEIKKKKNYYSIMCKNNNTYQEIKSKKIILAAGTISTTGLILRMLRIKKKVKLNHNPMLFGVLMLKNKIKKDKFSPSRLAARIFEDNKDLNSLVNFRGSNELIKEKIFKNFSFMKNKISKKFYNLLENNLIFFNLYLDSKYGNLFIKMNKNQNMNIFLEKKKIFFIKKKLKNDAKKIYENLKKNNLIFPFNFNIIPPFGNDNHYTGTIPINGKDKYLSLNENCELKGFKNLYIIDGSSLPINSSKFPTALIISNAYRIGKNFK